MRMPMNGGPATLVVKGTFSYHCAVQAPVCVLSEVAKDKRVFSWLDPLKGRGSDLAQTAATSDGWSLSSDAKSIALLPKDQSDQIQIINTADGKTRSIELKDWQVQSIAWSPDNQHIYASGFSASAFSIRLVALDGKFRNLSEVQAGQGWVSNPQPSPDGHYLAYGLRTWESNVTMLENF
jgi:WD40 repeat protein